MDVEFAPDMENIEKMFGFTDKEAERLIRRVTKIMDKDVDYLEGIKMIYEDAEDVYELGFMLIYYTSFNHAVGFDEFMEEISETEKVENKQSEYDIYM